MAVLRVDHPDIMAFITCKNNKKELNNFNISVGVTDQFMAAVEKKKDYDLIDPRSGRVTSRLNAAAVYTELIKQAWETGDPGIIFLDEINRFNTTPDIGEIESTNPCGEQPLLPMEACNLGSINLTRFITQKDKKPEVDYEKLRETIHLSVRFLDNAIDMSRYPIDEIDQMVREIGKSVWVSWDLQICCSCSILPMTQKKLWNWPRKSCPLFRKNPTKPPVIWPKKGAFFRILDQSIFKGKKNQRNAQCHHHDHCADRNLEHHCRLLLRY